jgi:hypothetical protein
VDPSTNTDDVHVAIRVDLGNNLGFGSSVRATWGMSLWIAIVIHILGVEIYVRAVPVMRIIKLSKTYTHQFLSRSVNLSLQIHIGVDSYCSAAATIQERGRLMMPRWICVNSLLFVTHNYDVLSSTLYQY